MLPLGEPGAGEDGQRSGVARGPQAGAECAQATGEARTDDGAKFKSAVCEVTSCFSMMLVLSPVEGETTTAVVVVVVVVAAATGATTTEAVAEAATTIARVMTIARVTTIAPVTTIAKDPEEDTTTALPAESVVPRGSVAPTAAVRLRPALTAVNAATDSLF